MNEKLSHNPEANKPEIGPETPLSQIPPIEESGSMIIVKSHQISELVEPPLRKSASIFFEKNIPTTYSSANYKDLERGFASIYLYYDGSSEVNKAVADRLLEQSPASEDSESGILKPIEVGTMKFSKNGRSLGMYLGVDQRTKLKDVEDRFVEVARQFDFQEAKSYSLDDLRRLNYSPNLTIEQAVTEGFYYDAKKGRFFVTEEIGRHGRQ